MRVGPLGPLRGLAATCFLALLSGFGPAPTPAEAQQTVRAGTVHPDTVRNRLMERLREAARSPEDTTAVEDTLAVEDPEAPRDPVAVRPGVEEGRALPPRPSPPAGSDAVMERLLQLEGFSPAVYEGVRADFTSEDRRLVLWGAGEEARARFSGEGVRLEADSSITYVDREGRVRTTGATVLTPPEGSPVHSRNMVYDVEERRGTAREAETVHTEGAMWIIRGDLDSVRDGELFGSRTRFTSCDLDPPHSYFEADQVKVIANRVLVARSVRMYMEDVPVMWLPFIAQNLESGRTSGILTPTFSVNDVVRTSTGANRRISNLGYYWAISDYGDLTAAMDWYSNNYTALEGGFRYRWARRFLDGRVNVKQFWRDGGGRELGLDTRHNWQMSERTRVGVSGRYMSSSDFVRRNSLDPRELSQTVNSDASLNRRFDWGTVSFGASRRQDLNTERVQTTLPSARLSLSTMTLFAAPPQQAHWYNNVSLSGSMSWDRNLDDRSLQADTAFSFGRSSTARTRGSVRGSVGIGDLSLSGDLRLDETLFRDVPGDFFAQRIPPGLPAFHGAGGFGDPVQDMAGGLERRDFRSGEAGWSARLQYRQHLIGSTTLSPSVSLEGRMVRVDSIAEARDFVSGPVRVRTGATLQTDLYGFYRGFGDFEAIRHKITPSVTWSYSPEVRPDAFQERVFGARELRTQNAVSLTFNQTWEARRREQEDPVEEGEDPEGAVQEALPELDDPPDPELELPEEAEEAEEDVRRDPDEPRRAPRSDVITLLALRTSAVNYDIVQADSTGRFVDGFTTTRLSNTVRSHFLEGLDLSFEHDLFDDSQRAEGGSRQLSPHLSRVSLSFSLNDRSGVVQRLGGLLGIDPSAPRDTEPEAEEDEVGREEEELPPDERAGFDPNRMIPGEDDPGVEERVGADGQREGWQARVSYSLRRPRDGALGGGLRAQMIQASLSFQPAPQWSADWSTSYDVERAQFNDHVVRLRRDLHEWEAIFGFRQTATGNWSFHFEVALKANRDLRFDFEQRSLDSGRSPGTGGGLGPF